MDLKQIIHFVPGPKKIRRKWRSFILVCCKHFCPKRYADLLFKNTFGHSIDWQHPRDLNEWIIYLSFKTDTHEWSRLSDKIAVREYVSSKGLGNILIPLYGVWEDASQIDFTHLPNSFAIKTNHACGNTIIVIDKATADKDLIKKKMEESLSLRFGKESAEPHYLRIKPKVLAEQLLPPPTNIDYKIWCFGGTPECIMTISDRDIESGYYCLNVYDLNWNKHPEWVTAHYQNEIDVPKPMKLDAMIEYARILSQGFPQVRVDFYNSKSDVYFGEMTFTSACGRMTYFTKECLTHFGEIINHYLSDNKNHSL